MIGWKHILVNNLQAYVTHEEKTRELFFTWPYHPQVNQIHTMASSDMLSFLDNYLYAENERHWLLCSRNIGDQRIQQSYWTNAFQPITFQAQFLQIWGLYRTQRIARSFNLRYLQQKAITKFYWNSRRLYFRPILGPCSSKQWPLFRVTEFFLKITILALCFLFKFLPSSIKNGLSLKIFPM